MPLLIHFVNWCIYIFCTQQANMHVQEHAVVWAPAHLGETLAHLGETLGNPTCQLTSKQKVTSAENALIHFTVKELVHEPLSRGGAIMSLCTCTSLQQCVFSF